MATAVAVTPVAVQQAQEPAAPVVVREVKSLPVQLAAYNPFYPYAQPVGPLGFALTIPLATATAALVPAVQGVTDLLTNLQLDPRLAQQPMLLTQSLVIPVAVGLQTALTSALDGTYVYGRFTPVQAINFFIDRLRTAIDQTIAAERALFGLPAVADTTSSTEDVASPDIVPEAKAVTLSTEQKDDSDLEGELTDTDVVESLELDEPAAEKPTWKRPTLKTSSLTVRTVQRPTGDYRTRSDSDDTEAGPKDTDSQGSSGESGSED